MTTTTKKHNLKQKKKKNRKTESTIETRPRDNAVRITSI